MTLLAFKNVNLALRFFLELAVLVALGYWGFQTGQNVLFKILFGIGLPIIAIIVWAILGAPRSTHHLQGVGYLILSVIFFGAAALALYLAGQHTLGILFALIFAINHVFLNYVLE